MTGEEGVDALQPLGMAEGVLRHPPRPAVDAGQPRLGDDPDEGELGPREPDELLVRRAR